MMTEQYVEQEGKTVEEAVELALQKLGVSRDNVKITILSEGAKGLFGIGSKPFKVRVSLKEDISSTPAGILKTILKEMGIESEIENRIENGNIYLTIRTQNPAILIGRHGATLNSVQYLVNCIANRSSLVKRKIIIDAEQYRKKRTEILTNLAYRLASKVKMTGQEVVVEPMNPQDRRIIHMALQNDSQIVTFSRGEGPLRRVVITTRDRTPENHKDDDYD